MYRSMMQIDVKNSVQAISFYQNAFDAKLICRHEHENGTIAHAELDVYGQILAICETPEEESSTGNTMQFCLHFGEGKETLVRSIIEKLSDGASFTYHGPIDWSPLLAEMIDKFGVNWSIFV